MESKVTITALQQMKRDGRKIVGVVAYDFQMAQIVDRAGVDIVSVGDSVGTRMWGQESDLEVTLDQMILACQAVRRGVTRALVSCDFPFGPLQEGPDAAGWAPFDATLLRATDELHADAFLSDATWKALAERYDTQQIIDLIFAIGQYNLVSMALNSLGVQLEAGMKGF